MKRILSFLCFFFLFFLLSFLTTSKAHAQAISVSPQSGTTNTTYTLTGSGLKSSYSYNVRFCQDSSCNTVYPESLKLVQYPTDGSGNLSYPFAISETGTIYTELDDLTLPNPIVATTTFTVTTGSQIACCQICPANSPAGTCASSGTCAWTGYEWQCGGGSCGACPTPVTCSTGGCNVNSDCCSGSCDPLLKVCNNNVTPPNCTPNGGACSVSSQCCSANCDIGKLSCQPIPTATPTQGATPTSSGGGGGTGGANTTDWTACETTITLGQTNPTPVLVPTIGCLFLALNNVILEAFEFAFAIAVIFLIIGGIKYLMTRGDPQKLDSARKTITYALIGLVVIILSYLILSLISYIIGVQILAPLY